jgi:hypothetical protein
LDAIAAVERDERDLQGGDAQEIQDERDLQDADPQEFDDGREPRGSQ